MNRKPVADLTTLEITPTVKALVLKHEQQIKDIAAHLLEIKQLITPMMEFKQEKSKNEPVGHRRWDDTDE